MLQVNYQTLKTDTQTAQTAKPLKISQIAIDKLNQIHQANTAESPAAIKRLFQDSQVVIIGENHFKQECQQYVYANKDYLFAPENNVLILTEALYQGISKDEIYNLKDDLHGSFEYAALISGANIQGLETNPLTKVYSKYDSLEKRVNTAKTDDQLVSLAKELQNNVLKDLQQYFTGCDDNQSIINTNETLSQCNRCTTKENLKGELQNLIRHFIAAIGEKMFSSALLSRHEENQPMANVILQAMPYYKNILVLVGATHAVDTISKSSQTTGIKTLLNQAKPNSTEAYFISDTNQFLFKTRDFLDNGEKSTSPCLYLASQIESNSKDIINKFVKLANETPYSILHQQEEQQNKGNCCSIY